MALRNLATAYGIDMPRYLLAPDVVVQLSKVPDMKKRLFIDALWNTGGRLNEILSLTREDLCTGRSADRRPAFLTVRGAAHAQAAKARGGRAQPPARPANEGGTAGLVKKHGIGRRSGWAHFSATTSASMNTLPTLRLSRRVWSFNRY